MIRMQAMDDEYAWRPPNLLRLLMIEKRRAVHGQSCAVLLLSFLI